MEKKMQKKTTGKTTKAKNPQEMTDETHSMLYSFFTDELKDIYWAEKKLVKSLPKLQKAATNEELKNAFAEHLEQTKEHVTRIEQVFELLGEKAQAKKCDAMEGLTKEAESIIEDTEDGTSTRDVGLIMAAQKAEHYEIATYGGLVQLANTLGLGDISNLLQATLDEEKETDQTLTEIAESKVNHMSLEEEEA
ncbi:MAG TPA: ferritin-like domain-containing protein [Ferruginibacter sp.]|nr:ferritin-like domain-containing protein [Ferruginibacter sp.]